MDPGLVDKDVPFALSTLNGGEFLIQKNDTNYTVSLAGGDLNDGTWHHVAATYDGPNRERHQAEKRWAK